jgi:GMP synthase-like glutamine amidotransferase
VVNRVKVLGICFGHQIIARALGVEVQRSPTWEASVIPIKLSEDGKALFGVEELVCHMPLPAS